MSNNPGPKLWLSVFFLVLLVAVGGIGCQASGNLGQTEDQPPPKDPNEAIVWITLWLERSYGQQAEEAEADWLKLKKRLGPMYDRLPASEKTLPYGQLNAYFFAEGKYDRAYDMSLEYIKVIPRTPDYELIYTAGLAGRKEWLTNLGQANRESKDELLQKFIRANLAWVSCDYQQVLAEAKVPEGTNPSSESQAEAMRWLELLRAKALARQGNYGTALEKITALMGTMHAGMNNNMHMTLLAADYAERANKYQEALVCTQLFLRLFPDALRGKCWSRQADAMRAMAERVKDKVSEEQRREVEEGIHRILNAKGRQQ